VYNKNNKSVLTKKEGQFMEFDEMCRFILKGRKEMEEAINRVLRLNGCHEIKKPGSSPILIKKNTVVSPLRKHR